MGLQVNPLSRWCGIDSTIPHARMISSLRGLQAGSKQKAHGRTLPSQKQKVHHRGVPCNPVTNSVVKYEIEPGEGDSSTHGHQDQPGVPGFLAAARFRICADVDSANRIGGYSHGQRCRSHDCQRHTQPMVRRFGLHSPNMRRGSRRRRILWGQVL